MMHLERRNDAFGTLITCHNLSIVVGVVDDIAISQACSLKAARSRETYRLDHISAMGVIRQTD